MKKTNAEKDLLLVKAIRMGNTRESEKAFSELYNRYNTHMSFLMKRNTKDDCLVEDIVIKAFEKAYLNINLFKSDDGAFSTWLYTIAKNLYIDHLRKTKNERNTFVISESEAVDEDGNAIGFEIEDKNLVPDSAMIQRETHSALRKIVSELKNDLARKIITMRYFDEKSYEEIASELEKPIGTVKGTIHRTKGILAEELRKRNIKQGEY